MKISLRLVRFSVTLGVAALIISGTIPILEGLTYCDDPVFCGPVVMWLLLFHCSWVPVVVGALTTEITALYQISRRAERQKGRRLAWVGISAAFISLLITFNPWFRS